MVKVRDDAAPAHAAGFTAPSVLSDAIAAHIVESIALLKIPPGSQIVESSIAQDLRVSRVPVREALKILRGQGLLEGNSHRSLRVIQFSERHIQEVRRLRVELEIMLLESAVTHIGDSKHALDEPRQAIEDMRNAVLLKDNYAANLADLRFHRSLNSFADAALTAHIWEAISQHILITFSIEGRSDGELEDIVVGHQTFLSLVAEVASGARPPSDLRKIVAWHVDPSKAAIADFLDALNGRVPKARRLR